MKKFQKAMIFVLLICFVIQLTSCGSEEEFNQFSLYAFDYNGGQVTCSADDDEDIPDGEEVTLKAIPTEGYSFAGWTKGNYFEDYGELVSEDAEYTFVKSGNEKYYANFVEDNEALVCYYANGGTINSDDAKNDRLIQKVSMGVHKYPTTIEQNGTFVRDGYVMTEYTSAADGTGDVTNIGQRAFISNEKIINLYVQWSKETDASSFTFEEKDGGYFVTKYSGNDEIVTIPSKYSGKDVVGIKSKAISSKRIKTVVLPSAILTVEDNAFSGCSALNKVYLYDNIENMTDDSFSGCSIKTVCINSVFEKKYLAQGAGKLEVVAYQNNADTNKLVVISGSSGMYGLDSASLQKSLNKNYSIANFAMQISVPATFSMSMMKPFLRNGDVIVLAPECDVQQFNNKLSTFAFTRFDGAFTSIRNIDVSEYTSFFTSLAVYSSAKKTDSTLVSANEQFYTDNGDHVDEQGQKDFAATAEFTVPTKHIAMTSSVYKRFNKIIDAFKNDGIKCYLSFAPFCSEVYTNTVSNDTLDAYSVEIGNKLHSTRISKQSDYNFSKNYFFELFHVTKEGKQLRTNKLADDLNAQFAKEK